MKDLITVAGLVATEPNHTITKDGLSITNFRLVSSQRRYDKVEDKWVDGDTNWFTVSMFRQLATNFSASVKKGDKVLVAGRLRIREWNNGDRKGVTVEIEADSVGHDLTWGTSAYSRTLSAAPTDAIARDFAAAPAGEEEFAPSARLAHPDTVDPDSSNLDADGPDNNPDAIDPGPTPLSAFSGSAVPELAEDALATPF